MATVLPDATAAAPLAGPSPLVAAIAPAPAVPSREVAEDAGEDPRRFDFSFAFNNADFADREIQLHISPDLDCPDSPPPERCAAPLDDTRETTAAAPGVFLRGDTCSGSPDQAASMPGARPQPPARSCLGTPRDDATGTLGFPRGGGSPGRQPSSSSSQSPVPLRISLPPREAPGTLGSPGRQVSSGGGQVSSGGGQVLSGGGQVLSGGGGQGLLLSGGGGGGGSSVSSSSSDLCGGVPVRVVSLRLSSVVLAAKSSFFRTLFTCGLKEACNNSNPVVLNVAQEEEGPLIELLRFIYTGDMQGSSSEPEDIIKMYLVADKFGVTSCMKICLERLGSLPMTVPTACLYLSLPDSMHSNRGVMQLLDSSRSFLVAHFRDLERVHKGDEFLALPLVGVQTLLASDDLNVRDELTAFHAMVEWLQHHHEDLEERRRAAVKLAEHVRFPLMTGDDLEETVLKTPEMESPECQALVREAAWFRAYSLVRRLRLMNEAATLHRRFWQRQWNRHSVGHVYFDIHLERFQTLAISATVESAAFGIGGKRFYLSARHGRRDDGTETLDIHLHLENSHSVQPEIQVSFIFYAKRWPEGQFDYLRDRVTKGFGRNASNWGYSNILGRPWSEVVQDNSKYFHNGVMSVFAEVQILEHQQPQEKGERSSSPVVNSQA